MYFYRVQSNNRSRISSHLFERIVHLNDKEVKTLPHCSGTIRSLSGLLWASREHEVRPGVLRRRQTEEMLSSTLAWPKAGTHCLWPRLFIASLEWLSYAQNKGLCLLAQGVSPQTPSQWMPRLQWPKVYQSCRKLVCLEGVMANITFYHNRFIKKTITLGKQLSKLSSGRNFE